MEPRRPYPTDLSDREWALIQHLVPATKPGGRPEKYPKREILDAAPNAYTAEFTMCMNTKGKLMVSRKLSMRIAPREYAWGHLDVT